MFIEKLPFVILGGELHNSTASNIEYFASKIDRLKELNCNTLILPAYWELIEPSEGVFDFELVDKIIEICDNNGFKIVLLWFATWKNAYSTYVPEWVKSDKTRFFRARNKDGRVQGTISCFCGEARDADAKAFAELMKHLKATDKNKTVIMMQLQNEAGVLGMRRDYCEPANEQFGANVPGELLDYLKNNTDFKFNYNGENWSSVFHEMADECFMSYYTAKYIEEAARRGKAEYDMPMFVNAWLVQFDNQAPGAYPSGGPTHRVIDIWRAAAPSIDIYAPDIYLDDFPGVCAQYAREDNPLLIPEVRRDNHVTANLLYAIGKYKSIGFAPFGIESMDTAEPSGAALAQAYSLLSNMMGIIIDSYKSDSIAGVHWLDKHSLSQDIGGFRIAFNITGESGGAIVITESEGKYIIIGQNIRYSINHDEVEYMHIREGRYENGVWVDGRRLNGDEMHLVTFGDIPEVQRVYVQRKD